MLIDFAGNSRTRSNSHFLSLSLSLFLSRDCIIFHYHTVTHRMPFLPLFVIFLFLSPALFFQAKKGILVECLIYDDDDSLACYVLFILFDMTCVALFPFMFRILCT